MPDKEIMSDGILHWITGGLIALWGLILKLLWDRTKYSTKDDIKSVHRKLDEIQKENRKQFDSIKEDKLSKADFLMMCGGKNKTCDTE